MRVGPVLLVMALVGCTAPSPAPNNQTARAIRSAPQTVILQAADLPAGYAIEKDEAMAPDDLANGLGTTPAELKQRFAFGYVRSYTKSSDPFICCVIDSILIMTADETAAIATANEFRTRALELGSIETEVGETIGDQARAFTFQQPTAESVLITVTLLFRYANVVDAVEVTGRIGSFERSLVVDLAKRQLARLRADADRP